MISGHNKVGLLLWYPKFHNAIDWPLAAMAMPVVYISMVSYVNYYLCLYQLVANLWHLKVRTP